MPLPVPTARGPVPRAWLSFGGGDECLPDPVIDAAVRGAFPEVREDLRVAPLRGATREEPGPFAMPARIGMSACTPSIPVPTWLRLVGAQIPHHEPRTYWSATSPIKIHNFEPSDVEPRTPGLGERLSVAANMDYPEATTLA